MTIAERGRDRDKEGEPAAVLELSLAKKYWVEAAGVRRFLMAAAWAVAAFIAFATLGPRSTRPHLAAVALERFGAYFIMAALFVAAYPRRPWLVCSLTIAAAVLLELGQFFAVGRDPGVKDAVEKILGGVFGVASVVAALRLEQRLTASRGFQ